MDLKQPTAALAAAAHTHDTVAEELQALGGHAKEQQAILDNRLASIAAAVRDLKTAPPVPPWRWLKPQHRLAHIGGLHTDLLGQVDEIVGRCLGQRRFSSLRIDKPTGVVLIGPSGVGKTMLAHAIAAELKCPELCVVNGPALLGSLEQFELLFETARGVAAEGACVVVFFDELEVLGEHRHGTRLSGIDTLKHLFVVKLMTQLEELRGAGVLVVGATNRVDMLEPALLRSGRFEKQLYLDLPTPEGRRDILERIRKRRDSPVRLALLESVAKDAGADSGTNGFSGADLADLLTEGAVRAALRGGRAINMQDLKEGIRLVRRHMHRHTANDPEQLFTRSLAALVSPLPGPKSGFDRVAGLDNAKKRMRLLVEILIQPERFHRAKCILPRGALMSGPPGVGKTLLARATAEEATVPFLSVTASDFVEMYVGVGAARVRDTFRIARRHAPCILFIDEIDAFGSRRGGGSRGAEEHNQTLNELLAQLSGIEENKSIIVIGATNRPALLDMALVRPGRLEFHIEIGIPDDTERQAIFELYRLPEDSISDETRDRILCDPRLRTGAAISSLMNGARILAALDNKSTGMGDAHLQDALESFSSEDASEGGSGSFLF